MRVLVLIVNSIYWYSAYRGETLDVVEDNGFFYKVIDTPHNRKVLLKRDLERIQILGDIPISVEAVIPYTPTTNHDARQFLSDTD